MLYNINVGLVTTTGQKYENWVMADDKGTRSVFTRKEALEFVEMTMKREEFRSVTIIPAEL